MAAFDSRTMGTGSLFVGWQTSWSISFGARPIFGQAGTVPTVITVTEHPGFANFKFDNTILVRFVSLVHNSGSYVTITAVLDDGSEKGFNSYFETEKGQSRWNRGIN